jgi:hypothetical protein
MFHLVLGMKATVPKASVTRPHLSLHLPELFLRVSPELPSALGLEHLCSHILLTLSPHIAPPLSVSLIFTSHPSLDPVSKLS